MACPRRVLVVILGFFGLLISIGFRSVFTMVVVHVMKYKGSAEESEAFFPDCNVNGTSRDFHRGWNRGYGLLFQTSYFAGSFITQVPGGILAAQFSARRVCGISILLSSLLLICLPFGIENQTWAVFFIRCLQGLVEGPSVPAINGVIMVWAPRSEKGRMLTAAYAGAYLSTAVAEIASGACICYVSWHAVMFIYGGLGVVWALIWLFCMYDSPSAHPDLSPHEKSLYEQEGETPANRHHKVKFSEIPWGRILCSLPVSALFVGSFCRNWIFSLLITEQPQYFKDVYHMHASTIGIFSAIPHVLMTMVVLTGGVLFDKLIKHKTFGITTTVARKLAQTLGFGIEGVCMFVLGFIDQNETYAIVLLCVGVGFSGFAISGYQVNPLDLAPRYVSVLTAISRLGSIGAILSTLVAAKLPGETHSENDWKMVFKIAGSIHLAGVIYFAIFASGKKQSWAEPDETRRPLLGVASAPSESALSSGYDSDEEREDLLTKSLHVPHLCDERDEYGSPLWFLNTI